ncbi:unnamed protein product [Microthlaspi erraticum]|uniref:Mitochondrial import inner membrane translocase subunit TIM50 n=1 Tax=Microthlaspi erraticum TaxID=1685480 RepID=A0A6D2K1Q0_9BRAS|nr:unnamed protein product [Microthlaspi erraticum]
MFNLILDFQYPYFPASSITFDLPMKSSRFQAAKVLYLSSIDEPPNPTRLCLGDYSKSPKEYFLSLFFSKNRKYPFCLDNSKSPHPAQLPPLLDSSLTATSSHPAQHQSFSSVKLRLAPLQVRPYVLMHFLTDSRSASTSCIFTKVHSMSMRKKPKNRSPDATCGPNLVYKRPFAEEFMKFCLERFEVGVWSSARESNVDAISNIVLEDLKDELLFVWDQKQSTNSGCKTQDNSARPIFFKDVSKVFQSFKKFSASNTIFIDHEPYKAFLNPEIAGVFPVSYDPSDKNDDFLDPEGEFCSYLDDLANRMCKVI